MGAHVDGVCVPVSEMNEDNGILMVCGNSRAITGHIIHVA